MPTYRQNKADNTQTQETGAHLGHGAIVNLVWLAMFDPQTKTNTDLLAEAQAAEKEGHAQDEQQIGQDRAKERCLDDADFVLDEGNAAVQSVFGYTAYRIEMQVGGAAIVGNVHAAEG